MRRIFVVGADTKGDLLICKRLSRKQGARPSWSISAGAKFLEIAD
jgi:hypothetical protein